MRILVFLVLMGFSCASAMVGQSTPPSESSAQNISAEIHAIESGLLPAITVAGNPHPTRMLLEEMKRRHVPAVSVAVIHKGTLRWAHAWGTLDPRQDVPVTTESLFQAASISKSLAAMGALHLVEQGKLSLDAPVQTELKSWSLPQNDLTAQHPVTLRELLSHTAGINVHGFPGYASTDQIPTLKQVLDGEKPASTEAIRVVSRPGQAHDYSGGGYTIVQQMMIDASNQSFPQLMETAVLGPIGMRHSTYQQPLSHSRLEEVALPADREGDPIVGGPHIYPEMAAAGLWTTPTDLAKWVLEMQRSLHGGANHVLSPEMTRVMLTPVKGDYGLGVGVMNRDGELDFEHSGSNAGYMTYYIGFDSGDGAVIMTSGANGNLLYPDLLRSISRAYGWPIWKSTARATISLTPSELKAYTGKFTAQTLGPIEFTMNAGHLQANLSYRGSSPLVPSAINVFFATETDAEVQFDSPDSGNILIQTDSFRFNRNK